MEIDEADLNLFFETDTLPEIDRVRDKTKVNTPKRYGNYNAKLARRKVSVVLKEALKSF